MPKVHVVRAGEGLTSIAADYGHFEATIWNHPDNAALKSQREDPNALAVGDQVVVPELRPKEVQCATGARHCFRRKGVPATYRVQVCVRGRPLANCPWKLDIDAVQELEGETDADGIVETFVPTSARRGRLTVTYADGERAVVLKVALGELAPARSLAGVQRRLENLGYAPGRVDGVACDATHAAVSQLQQRHGLEPTGDVDDETRALLDDLHDQTAVHGPTRARL